MDHTEIVMTEALSNRKVALLSVVAAPMYSIATFALLEPVGTIWPGIALGLLLCLVVALCWWRSGRLGLAAQFVAVIYVVAVAMNDLGRTETSWRVIHLRHLVEMARPITVLVLFGLVVGVSMVALLRLVRPPK
jgi:hypothetical protein